MNFLPLSADVLRSAALAAAVKAGLLSPEVAAGPDGFAALSAVVADDESDSGLFSA